VSVFFPAGITVVECAMIRRESRTTGGGMTQPVTVRIFSDYV
jgi:hypothetical protein